MSAKYPEIFIRPAGVPLDLSSGNTELFLAAQEGWTRLQNVLQGASFKIDPGLQQKLNRGQARTLSEKIGVEVKLTFIDQNAYNAHRQLINQNTDMIFYDPDDPSDMITAFWGLSLSVKAEMEGGNGYTVILGAEHEVSTGAGVTMESNSGLRLVTFNVYNAATDEPLAAMIVLYNQNLMVSESGTAWVLAHYEEIGEDDATVEGTGYNHEAYSIELDGIYHNGHYEHIVNVGLVVNDGQPCLSVTPTSIDFGQVQKNNKSYKTVTLTGSNLKEDVIVSAPNSCRVSLTVDSPLFTSITIPRNKCNVTFEAVFWPGSLQSYSGVFVCQSGDVSVAVTYIGVGVE